MKRSPTFAAILAAAAIAIASASTAGAHENGSATHDQCGMHSDETIDRSADMTCSAVDQTPSGDQGMKQDGQTGTDSPGATPSSGQGMKQDGQTGTDSPDATPVGGSDGETVANPDETAKPAAQPGTAGQTLRSPEQVSKELGQGSTDDQIIQMPDLDAVD
jgi:hypothetical protein